VERVRRIELR